MEKTTFEMEIQRLLEEIESCPSSDHLKIMNLNSKRKRSPEVLKKEDFPLHHSLDYLRISVKYLVFDLEATRRENAYLKSLIDEPE